MEQLTDRQTEIVLNGFTIADDIYNVDEISAIISAINNADKSSSKFRRTEDLFAIRQFLKEVPHAKELIFNGKLKQLIKGLFGEEYFIVKSIYFDKPQRSNWFVAWHQDLTISVDKKLGLPGYGPWTTKLDQFAVQPPIDILKDNFTIRIHLDDTDEGNGALKVISGSHLNIIRPETLSKDTIIETGCDVAAGGVMIMHPLLMHSSGRTTSDKQRRVVHIEFSRIELATGINWAEKDNY